MKYEYRILFKVTKRAGPGRNEIIKYVSAKNFYILTTGLKKRYENEEILKIEKVDEVLLCEEEKK